MQTLNAGRIAGTTGCWRLDAQGRRRPNKTLEGVEAEHLSSPATHQTESTELQSIWHCELWTLNNVTMGPQQGTRRPHRAGLWNGNPALMAIPMGDDLRWWVWDRLRCILRYTMGDTLWEIYWWRRYGDEPGCQWDIHYHPVARRSALPALHCCDCHWYWHCSTRTVRCLIEISLV